jgi:hypothetical protein
MEYNAFCAISADFARGYIAMQPNWPAGRLLQQAVAHPTINEKAREPFVVRAADIFGIHRSDKMAEPRFDSIKPIGLAHDHAAAVTSNRGASTVPRSVAASAVISSRDSGA